MTERYLAGRENGTPRVATVAGGPVHLSSAHGLGVRRDLENVFDFRMKVIGERFPAAPHGIRR